jgi:hypothetical protein
LDANIPKEFARMAENALTQYVLPLQFTSGTFSYQEQYNVRVPVDEREDSYLFISFGGKTIDEDTGVIETGLVGQVGSKVGARLEAASFPDVINSNCSDCAFALQEPLCNVDGSGDHITKGSIIALSKYSSNLLYTYRNWFKMQSMKIQTMTTLTTYEKQVLTFGSFDPDAEGGLGQSSYSLDRRVFPQIAIPTDCDDCFTVVDAVQIKWFLQGVEIIYANDIIGGGVQVPTEINLIGDAYLTTTAGAYPQYVSAPGALFDHVYGAQNAKKQYGILVGLSPSSFGLKSNIAYTHTHSGITRNLSDVGIAETIDGNFSVLAAFAAMESQKIL